VIAADGRGSRKRPFSGRFRRFRHGKPRGNSPGKDYRRRLTPGPPRGGHIGASTARPGWPAGEPKPTQRQMSNEMSENAGNHFQREQIGQDRRMEDGFPANFVPMALQCQKGKVSARSPAQGHGRASAPRVIAEVRRRLRRRRGRSVIVNWQGRTQPGSDAAVEDNIRAAGGPGGAIVGKGFGRPDLSLGRRAARGDLVRRPTLPWTSCEPISDYLTKVGFAA